MELNDGYEESLLYIITLCYLVLDLHPNLTVHF